MYMYLNAIRENKNLAKISEFTVSILYKELTRAMIITKPIKQVVKYVSKSMLKNDKNDNNNNKKGGAIKKKGVGERGGGAHKKTQEKTSVRKAKTWINLGICQV